MGTIRYGDSNEIHIEDRALSHLKVAIATKLRRNESFTLSWKHPEGTFSRPVAMALDAERGLTFESFE